MKIPCLLLMVAFARCACAQQTAPVSPLPPGPLLQPVADNTRWTITTTSKNAEAAKSEERSRTGKSAGRVRSPKAGGKLKAATIVGEKMGKLVHVLSVAADGTKEEEWTNGTLTAILTTGEQEPSFATDPIEEMPMPAWISRKNYVEAKSGDGKNCFVFRDRIIPADTEVVQDENRPDQTDVEKLKVEATAVIDANTHLPVAVTEGETTTTYKFEPLAPSTEIIPAAILTALTEREKKLQDGTRTSVRP